ncbi:MAG: hypothetical protein R6V85_02885 [Polyangia bacterium]
MDRLFTIGVSVSLVGAVSALGGCEGGCEGGESSCDGTLIMVCVEEEDDYETDDDYYDDDDDFIDLLFEAADPDTTWVESEDCADRYKVCVESQQEDGTLHAECDWEDIL